MFYYKFGYVVFERKIKKSDCENCKIRFNCIGYIAKEYIKEKREIKKLIEKSWDKETWNMINKKSIDMKNMKARGYFKKWHGK